MSWGLPGLRQGDPIAVGEIQAATIPSFTTAALRFDPETGKYLALR